MAGNPNGSSRTAVIVLNWNRPAETTACLRSLVQLPERPHVLVVDNGSTDESVAWIATHHPWAEYLTLDRNRGFGGGMNAGILALLTRPDPPEFVWLLNNDTIVDTSALSALVTEADSEPRVAAVGSVLLDPTGRRVNEWGGATVNRVLWTTTPLVRPVHRRLDYVTGASMLLRVAALLEVGLFDERYFFYWEDADLSFRLKEGGWLLGFASNSRVYHILGATAGGGSRIKSSSAEELYAQSVATFVATWSLPRARGATLTLRLAVMLLSRLARGQVKMIPAVVRAYWRGVRIGKQEPQIPRPAVWSRS